MKVWGVRLNEELYELDDIIVNYENKVGKLERNRACLILHLLPDNAEISHAIQDIKTTTKQQTLSPLPPSTQNLHLQLADSYRPKRIQFAGAIFNQ